MESVTRPKLLLADDSVTIRKVVELTFADEGIDVTTAADAAAAMERFVQIQPDIVLVDVSLPDTNGYQICEMIKQDEATRHIPVLLLVGSFEPFDQDEAERVSADGFLTKPFHSIRDLVARVLDLLEPEKPAFPPAQELDDIDHLYQSSLVNTLEMDEIDPAQQVFDDGVFDDEMIETTYPAGTFHNDLAEFVEEVDDRENEPEHTATAAGNGIFDGEFFEGESKESIDPPETPGVREEEHAAGLPEYEISDPADRRDTAEPAGDPEPDRPADDMPALDEKPQSSVETKEFDWSPSAVVTEPQRPTRVFGTTFSFEESTAEETPGEVNETDEAELSKTISMDSGPAATADAALVSEVVRQVMERLSDSVVREIARESVPRIAEKLIREALEQDKSS